MQLSFASIISGRIRLAPAEAVALVLAADATASANPSGARTRLPDVSQIFLNHAGHVSFDRTVCDETSDVDSVKQLAALLGRLLHVGDTTRESHNHVPGPLLLLIARGERSIDLRSFSHVEFREALRRFGSAHPSTLAAVFYRCFRESNVGVPNAEALPSIASDPSRHAVIESGSLPHAPVRESHRFTVASDRVAAPDRRSLASPRRGGRLFLALTPARAWSAAAIVVALSTLIVLALNSRWASRPSPVSDRVKVVTVEQRVRVTRSTPFSQRVGEHVFSTRRVAEVEPTPLLERSFDGMDLFSPSFASHGREVFFHSGRHQAALMRASFDQGAQPIVGTILRDGAANYHATVSPDGEWLAFDSDRDGTRSVYVARRDGSDPVKIVRDGYSAVPRWSPDGRRLAFIKAEPNRPRVWNLWVADLADGSVSRVSNHRVGQAWSGSWFPDGQRITYSVEATLVIATLPSGAIRVVHSPRPGHLLRTPAVSPDGHLIVFQVHRDGIWLFDLRTGTMRRLLADRAAEEFAWSPDGRRLVYHTMHRGRWSLWQLVLDPVIS